MRKYDIFEWRTVHFFRGGLSKQGGHGGQALQILTDQLTLSQPGGGGAIMPTKLFLAPPNFQTFLRPCRVKSPF